MQTIARMLVALAISLIAGCAALIGPRAIVVSDAELSQRLASRFPIERRWLELFDVRISNPQVSTSAQTGLVRIALSVDIGSRLLNQQFAARLQLMARPRYEEQDHSLRIHDVSVDALQESDGESLLGSTGRWPAALLAQSLEGSTIYRLSSEQVSRLQQQGLELRSIAIGNRGGLQLNFEPATR